VGDPEEIVDAEIVPDPPAPTPQELAPTPQETGYTEGGVPTFESVREKIETRFGTAVGSSELASETAEGREVEKQYEDRQRAAHDRLEQIRASMRDEPDRT
jgi:phage shock protein A